jgi:DNA-binding NarL/FixJ family response regulator
MIRVLVADDQSLIRQALQIYLENENDIKLIACVDNGMKAIEKIEQLHPDVALIDLEMPGIDGLTATKIISQRFSETKVLVLSSYDSQEYINKALQAGAKGYLHKNTSAQEIVNVIRAVNQGYFQLGPGLHEKIAGDFGKEKSSKQDLIQLQENLTQRLQNIQQDFEQTIDSKNKLIYDKMTEIIKEQRVEIKQELELELDTELNNLKQEVEQGLRLFQQKVAQQMQQEWQDLKAHFDSLGLNNNNHQEQSIMRMQLMQLRESYHKLENKLALAYRVFFITMFTFTIIIVVIFYL